MQNRVHHTVLEESRGKDMERTWEKGDAKRKKKEGVPRVEETVEEASVREDTSWREREREFREGHRSDDGGGGTRGGKGGGGR